MAAANNPGYSTLEYVPNEYYNKKENPLPVYSGLQVVPPAEPGKQAYFASEGGLEVNSHHHDGPPPPPADVYQQEPSKEEPRSRRKWLIIGAVVALIIVIGAVVGGVVASKAKSSSSKDQDSAGASSGTTSSASSPTATPSGTQPATPSSTAASTSKFQKRNIAAISWSPSSSNNQTRLYFQNNDGGLVEAAIGDSKTSSGIPQLNGKSGIPWVSDAKRGSAIAAAVTRPGFPVGISVFYMDSNNLIHDIIWDGSWSPGVISAKGYIAAPNSSLSAMYNQCRFCANTTILAYQDANNFIQIANRTKSGWQTTQLLINQIENTGLALQPYYWAGMEDQIDLYYQRKDLKMAMASWKPFSLTSRASGWLPDQLWSEGAPNTPIATASSYSNVTSGTESWIQVLTVANTGITTNSWDGLTRNWVLVLNQNTVFSNATSEKSIKSVAVTATGKAFAAVSLNGTDSIESWQLADDFVNWSATGEVDIKNAWS